MRSNYMQIFSRVECHCWWKLDEEKTDDCLSFQLAYHSQAGSTSSDSINSVNSVNHINIVNHVNSAQCAIWAVYFPSNQTS